MNKLYLSFFLLLTSASMLAQDTTTTPVPDKSNRLILHFKDTTGKFTQLAHIFIDRGYDIDMKDREFGILRTKPSPLHGGDSFTDQLEIKTIFRDSSITFSGVTYSEWWGRDGTTYKVTSEVHYLKKNNRNIMLSWEELGKIAELLKPAFITYSTVDVTKKGLKAELEYKRNN